MGGAAIAALWLAADRGMSNPLGLRSLLYPGLIVVWYVRGESSVADHFLWSLPISIGLYMCVGAVLGALAGMLRGDDSAVSFDKRLSKRDSRRQS